MNQPTLWSEETFANDPLGTDFVRLTFQVNAHEIDEGITPDSIWHPAAETLRVKPEEALSKKELFAQLAALTELAEGLGKNSRSEVLIARIIGLQTRLTVLNALSQDQTPMSLRDEWASIYGARMKPQPEDNLDEIHQAIRALIPRRFQGLPVHEAVTAWDNSLRVASLVEDESTLRFLAEVSIARARQRIAALLGDAVLPPADALKLSFPMNVPFDGYVRCFGDHASLQIGRRDTLPPLLVIWPDLLTHEYFHFVQAWNWMMEASRKGWGELCVWNTFDPTLALIEGVAIWGAKLIWPHQKAVDLAIELYKEARIQADPEELLAYLRLKALLKDLDELKINAVLRLDEGASWEEIDQVLVKKVLFNPAKLPMLHAFVNAYRTYIWVYPFARATYGKWLESYSVDQRPWALKNLLTDLLIPSDVPRRIHFYMQYNLRRMRF